MTKADFKVWFNHHQAAFPGVALWFKKIPTDLRPTTIGLWQRALSHVELDAAIAATDAMLEESDRPRFYEEHPAAILQRVRRDKKPDQFKHRLIVDGEEAYQCLTCNDIGYLVCWHPKAMRHYRDHGKVIAAPRACAKACHCASGDQYERAYGRFNEKRWLAYHGDPEDEQRLKHFLENSQDSRREKAFDAFR